VARITRDAIDPRDPADRARSPSSGALLTFRGVVRDSNRGRQVVGIEYHAFEEMALAEMGRIEKDCRERWPGIAVEIVHRLGRLDVGEASVLIAVAAPHRAEGFAALRHAIDRLKETVPIWKKEIYPDGYAWIEGS
jgi:molybdopterin synthase catalytic subunit